MQMAREKIGVMLIACESLWHMPHDPERNISLAFHREVTEVASPPGGYCVYVDVRRGVAIDHKPPNGTFRPEFLLRRLIRMPIKRGVAYSGSSEKRAGFPLEGYMTWSHWPRSIFDSNGYFQHMSPIISYGEVSPVYSSLASRLDTPLSLGSRRA